MRYKTGTAQESGEHSHGAGDLTIASYWCAPRALPAKHLNTGVALRHHIKPVLEDLCNRLIRDAT
jgi:hypothetical protein